MLELLAQTTQPDGISISAGAAGTFAAVISIAWGLIKFGDRLWGKEKRDQRDQGSSNLDKLSATCESRTSRVSEHIDNLGDAMTKYIELQQAALKIEEYRHENVLKQLEILNGRLDENDRKRTDEIRSIHQRLDTIMQESKRR